MVKRFAARSATGEVVEDTFADGQARDQLKALHDQMGKPGGLATLDGGGKVPLDQLPVSDNTLNFGETSGEAGLWDREETTPTDLTPIRYNGVLRATRVYGMYYSDEADYAEAYAVEGEIEAGELAAICPDGALRRNTLPENPRVLGIVSTSPAALIGGGERGVPIALAGRVPVKAVGPISPGDLLTAGEVPGAVRTASAATPRGAVVAQALEALEGTGTVLARVLRL